MPPDTRSRLRRCAVVLCAAVFVAAVSHFAGSSGENSPSELAAVGGGAGLDQAGEGTTPPALRKQLRDMARFDVLAARAISKLQLVPPGGVLNASKLACRDARQADAPAVPPAPHTGPWLPWSHQQRVVNGVSGGRLRRAPT
ncbi:hypothetical protein T484DRAFT_1873706 [Baffinella frigidus]|nr:hypothetical protein T484DRAFT_1873706 [Cryptophyta sp. CCMP2293]